MCWNPLQLDATVPIIKEREEDLVKVRKEVQTAAKLLKATDDKCKALVKIVKENTKKVLSSGYCK